MNTMNPLTIVLIVAVLLVLWFIGIFNGLVRLRNRLKEALSDIDVQSKRRYDLIPNVVETVKGYAAHEKGVFEDVTKARSAAMGATGSPMDKAKAENQLSQTLKTLFAVSEAYPDLKANANFLALQQELSDTENKMMSARRFFNNAVLDLNTKIQSFPSNLVANMFGFKQEQFFENASIVERQPVQVKF
jgi:LemA protein